MRAVNIARRVRSWLRREEMLAILSVVALAAWIGSTPRPAADPISREDLKVTLERLPGETRENICRRAALPPSLCTADRIELQRDIAIITIKDGRFPDDSGA